MEGGEGGWMVDLEGGGMEGGGRRMGWKVEDGGWRVEGGGWKVEGEGWRVGGGGWRGEGEGEEESNLVRSEKARR